MTPTLTLTVTLAPTLTLTRCDRLMPKMKNDKMYVRLRNAPEAKPAKRLGLGLGLDT